MIVPIMILSILVAYFGASLLNWVPNRMARSLQVSWATILGCALILNIVVARQGGWTWTTDLGLFLLALALVISLYRYGTGFLTQSNVYFIMGCGLCGMMVGVIPALLGK
jgi:hypothetical protein